VTDNQTRFAEIYTEELQRAVAAHPDEYWLHAGETPDAYAARVAPKMVYAFIKGGANKDGHAMKATCKRLGIKHTYTAINDFLSR